MKDLHRSAYSYTRNVADAEDLVQETLLRAFRAFDSLSGEYRLKAWLLSIMRNAWISRYRASMRRPAETLVGDLHDGHVDSKALNSDTHSAEHLVLRDMPDPQLVDALVALPESLRLTVYYVAVVGLSCHEVAAVMSVPKGTVMSRMYRSRLHLRRLLGAYPPLAALEEATTMAPQGQPV
ncbi:sigma-70 family RNA polymerase sigma factor [Mycolicibacterium baixiangningiae]|uniref:sigma-70 family RNA polymerase sigma factor n=1 Tax=Mycolicibacterium baixiangningiae TaxID=2761578 RepID=UPI001E5EE9B7|nr:sigma-70 family RNA polymerase sigma factor [Mycolicibacterium baixiangningiae]